MQSLHVKNCSVEVWYGFQTEFRMSKRKEKREIEQKTSDKTSPKVRKKRTTCENSDDEGEKTLERLVFGGESDAIKALDKDFAVDQHELSSSDEVGEGRKHL